jgi:hypothetical protein
VAYAITSRGEAISMKKIFFSIILIMIIVFIASPALSHCGGRSRHVWRSNGSGGYYCEGGYGHGAGCRY